jgi:uncharacterized protein (DUF1684 family)
MLKFFLQICFICFAYTAIAQADSTVLKETKQFQGKVKMEYDNPNTTPLSDKAKKDFKGIHFYPVNTKYIVNALFIRTPQEKNFRMLTSSNEKIKIVKYAEVIFIIDKEKYKLNVYRSKKSQKLANNKDYLFIPFIDATSGNETYKGGRYVDLTDPKSNMVIVNFNKAYQPYCAYTDGYSCPITPSENHLPIKIEAGVRF